MLTRERATSGSAYKGGAVPEDTKNYKQRKHDIYLWVVPFKKVAASQ